MTISCSQASMPWHWGPRKLIIFQWSKRIRRQQELTWPIFAIIIGAQKSKYCFYINLFINLLHVSDYKYMQDKQDVSYSELLAGSIPWQWSENDSDEITTWNDAWQPSSWHPLENMSMIRTKLFSVHFDAQHWWIPCFNTMWMMMHQRRIERKKEKTMTTREKSEAS